MQQKNSGWMDKVSDFVAGKGFYIVLALCAAAIGVSGYVLFFTGGDEEFVDEPLQISGAVNDAVQTPAVQQNEQTEQPAQQQETMPKPADNPSRSDETSEKKKETAAAASAQAPVEQAEQTAAPKAETFISPVQNGQELREFSGDELVKDETMGDWRVHNGVDIACDDGGKVCAIGDGTVTDIFFDEQTGYCLTIDHGNGLTSTLRGLMKNATVKEGDSVKMGAVVGGGGSTMTVESKMAPHIHLEVAQDGKLIDPMSILSSAKQ